jgi:hypothetical protein
MTKKRTMAGEGRIMLNFYNNRRDKLKKGQTNKKENFEVSRKTCAKVHSLTVQ